MVARAGAVRGLEQLEQVRLCSVSKQSRGSVSIWSFCVGMRELLTAWRLVSKREHFERVPARAVSSYDPTLEVLQCHFCRSPTALPNPRAGLSFPYLNERNVKVSILRTSRGVGDTCSPCGKCNLPSNTFSRLSLWPPSSESVLE